MNKKNTAMATELAKTNKSESEIMKSLNIGAIAKRKRLELHLSQKEVSEAICSISYLSKIETNKIIPNSECLNLLMERINLNKNEIYLVENAKERLEETIKYIYYLEIDKYKVIIDEIKDVKNNQYADVIRLGYYILNKDVDNAKKIIDFNKRLLSSMDKNYIKMFSLLSLEYLLMIHDYENANRLLNNLHETDPINEMFSMLIKDVSYRLYAEQKRSVLASKIYHELINYYSEHAHIKRIIETKLIFIRMLFDEEEYKEIAKLVENSSFSETLLCNQEFIYIIAKSLYMNKNKDEAVDYYNMLEKDNKYYLLSLKEIYELTDDKIEFINEIERLNDEHSSFYYEYFLATIYNKIDIDLFNGSKYMDVLNNSTKIEKIALLKIERDYLTSKCKYKDANNITMKILDMLYSNSYK